MLSQPRVCLALECHTPFLFSERSYFMREPRLREVKPPAPGHTGGPRLGQARCAAGAEGWPSAPAGIPRSYVEAQEDYLRREAKLLKREGTPPPPPPPPRDLAEAYKARPLEALGPLKLKPAHEGLVATVKEAGRSIHEIPREELRRTPELPLAPRPLKEGSITQVRTARARQGRGLVVTLGGSLTVPLIGESLRFRAVKGLAQGRTATERRL